MLALALGGAGAGAGGVSWLRTWWRQVAGAGCHMPALVLALVLLAGCARGGDRVPVLVLVLRWLRTWWRQVVGRRAPALVLALRGYVGSEWAVGSRSGLR